MRVVVVLLFTVLAACTPDVLSETYLCGPDSFCPEGQACNGPDNVCVLASKAAPFSCGDVIITEPDDTASQAHVIPNIMCEGVPSADNNCMLEGDAEDWAKFTVPACSRAVQVEARVSFPIAFQRIALELWNLDQMTKLVEDRECPGSASGEAGEEFRCLVEPLSVNTSYGIKVRPAGDGNCDGNCRYNRYSLRVQLSTP